MAENEDLDLGEEKKSPKKWIILGAVIGLLLVGAGAGMYFMGMLPFGNGESSEDVAAGEEEVDEKSNTREAHFHQFEPLLVNFPRGSGARLMQIEFSVLAYDDSAIEVLQKHAPMIRNNLLLLLGRYKPQDLKTVQGKQALREAILSEIQQVMDLQANGEQVEALFFTKFLME